MSRASGARTWLLRVVSAIWGLPQTLIGGSMAAVLALRGAPHRSFRLSCVTSWRMGAGLSLGLFVFVPRGAESRLVVHEYGHTVESLILGPLYLPLVVVPSLIWAGLPACARLRRRRNISYYDMPIEHWANVLGSRVTGERSMGA